MSHEDWEVLEWMLTLVAAICTASACVAMVLVIAQGLSKGGAQ